VSNNLTAFGAKASLRGKCRRSSRSKTATGKLHRQLEVHGKCKVDFIAVSNSLFGSVLLSRPKLICHLTNELTATCAIWKTIHPL